MKKNISINISGIIFHIEEDGYDRLKEYLDSINKYFSTFDDSSEIISDIESRIAEIFLSKLNEGKQVINSEDVEALITTMGSIQDFQAIEEEPQTEQPQSEEKTYSSTAQPKKLIRDGKRKLLGGVASGIAHYFSVDPLWIRLIFIVLAFDVFLTFAISSLLVIAYIVLWVVLPESFDMKDDKQIKKMYRNPEDRVLAGVASGVAAYFGTDVAVIRVLFVVGILLGGSGLIAYLILWIILPEARSITDKVQMKGDPVTLENIESNIKSSLNVKEEKEGQENTFVRILLFPFRLIATVISGIARALGPILGFLVEVFRVLAGLILILIGISTLFGLLVTLGTVLGLVAGAWTDIDIFPLHLMQETFPALGIGAAFFATAIPALGIILAGVAVIAKTKIVNATVGWTMFAIWLVSIISLSFIIPGIIYDFRTDGEFVETKTLDVSGSILVLDLRETGMEEYDVTDLRIRGHKESDVRLLKEFGARGSSRKTANENAQMVSYRVDVNDSIVTFDSNITFNDDANFRGQHLDMTLYVPYGQKFIMTDDLGSIIRNTLNPNGYRYYHLGNENVWTFNPTGLECITCDGRDSRESRTREYREQYQYSYRNQGYHKEYDMVDFTSLEIDGPFKVTVFQGNEYDVTISGSESRVEMVDVHQDGDKLNIEMNENYDGSYRGSNQVHITITSPELANIELDGNVTADIRGFDQYEFEIKLSGAATADVDVEINRLTLDLNGRSQLEITGHGNELDADLSSGSVLESYGYKVNRATIEASGASVAEVYATETLDIYSSLVSEVNYRGGADVTNHERSRRTNDN